MNVAVDRTPGTKLGLAMLVGMLLSIPLFSVWLLVYDRETQSTRAQASITQGWGGPQSLAAPVLVIPYRKTVTETVTENNKPEQRSREVWHELTLAPELADLATTIHPDRRKRSIYEAVVYRADVSGQSRFALPSDLNRLGVAIADMALDRAELRFGLSDPRGLFGEPPRVTLAGAPLPLQPGHGAASTGGSGFFAWVDARSLAASPLQVGYRFAFRGSARLSLLPQGGETRWRVQGRWPHPSFQGGFLPAVRSVGAGQFTARYQIGNLALGQSLIGDAPAPTPAPAASDRYSLGEPASFDARIDLVQPVDLYSQLNRATKYGFLFIGFTFIAFLLFDVIGGVRVSPVEYLLVGAAMVLFFVLLLALAEVIGFLSAYLLASAAIIGLNTAYSAAVLKSWRRASLIGGLLTLLYGSLYVLLSLEDLSLLIGSLMLFLGLATVMYLTRNFNWGAVPEPEPNLE